MCFCGLKASPLLCLCGITLGSCPLSDPTVFMRKQQEGFILLSSSSFLLPSAFCHPPVLSTFFLPLSSFLILLSPTHSRLLHAPLLLCRSLTLFYSPTVFLPPLFLFSTPLSSELSSRLLPSFLFSLLPSSLFGSHVFCIPHALPPLFDCLVTISSLLTSSPSFSPPHFYSILFSLLSLFSTCSSALFLRTPV